MASYDSGAGGLVALRTPAMDFDPTRTATKAATGQARPLQPAISIVFHPSRRFEGSSRVPGRGETILLGRESEDLVPGALDDSRISRRHATIQRHGASLELEDLGSHNGTRVNGHTVTRAVLNPGDVVAVGPLLLLVQQLDPQTRVPGHPRILGRSAALGRLLALIERVASTEVTVLVLGEPGVGKELIAEEIHRQSGRSGALVTLNCAGVADGVIQSELFGSTSSMASQGLPATSRPSLIRAASRETRPWSKTRRTWGWSRSATARTSARKAAR